jgi:hypothetical protein
MTTGYSHGPISCRDCYAGEDSIMALGDWRLHNNPGYYGSSSPEILVLGFSKGANQNKTAVEGDFDKVAFAKSRHRLQDVLETLNLMPSDRSIDHLMTAKEKYFGVASLVRCSFCKMKGGTCKTIGDVIPSSFTNKSTLKIIETCSSKYLGSLPGSTKLVILLGTSETYIKKTKELIQRLHMDFNAINHVSFVAGGALWVYATHPSPGNGYFKAWVKNGSDDQSGHKRILAQEALSKHYA